MIQQFHFWVYIWRKWNHCLKKISPPPVHWSIIHSSKIWKQSKCLSMDDGENVNNIQYILFWLVRYTTLILVGMFPSCCSSNLLTRALSPSKEPTCTGRQPGEVPYVDKKHVNSDPAPSIFLHVTLNQSRVTLSPWSLFLSGSHPPSPRDAGRRKASEEKMKKPRRKWHGLETSD